MGGRGTVRAEGRDPVASGLVILGRVAASYCLRRVVQPCDRAGERKTLYVTLCYPKPFLVQKLLLEWSLERRQFDDLAFGLKTAWDNTT